MGWRRRYAVRQFLNLGGAIPPDFFKDSTMKNYPDYGDYPPDSIWWETQEPKEEESFASFKNYNWDNPEGDKEVNET